MVNRLTSRSGGSRFREIEKSYFEIMGLEDFETKRLEILYFLAQVFESPLSIWGFYRNEFGAYKLEVGDKERRLMKVSEDERGLLTSRAFRIAFIRELGHAIPKLSSREWELVLKLLMEILEEIDEVRYLIERSKQGH